MVIVLYCLVTSVISVYLYLHLLSTNDIAECVNVA